jgi:hypothetical protein
MAEIKPNETDETLSVSEMYKLFEKEVRTVTRAADLRIRDFAHFTTDYAAGKITPEQAMDQYFRHEDKWGDALPGVVRPVQNLSDNEIIEAMEKAAGPYTTREDSKRRYQKLFGNRDRGSE